ILAQRVSDWDGRRRLQLLALVAPLSCLGLAALGVHHFVGQVCLNGAPAWDRGFGAAVILGMFVVALGGLLLSLVRLATIRWILSRECSPAPRELQAMVDGLADRLAAPRARVLIS